MKINEMVQLEKVTGGVTPITSNVPTNTPPITSAMLLNGKRLAKN
ncbi:hypothetical protein [Pseudoalteromonas luteoviolacea]|nr:hypothetical protein [Pseudoalteromonas luteoviolacea]